MASMDSITEALQRTLITITTEVDDNTEDGLFIAADLIRGVLDPVNPGIVERYIDDLCRLAREHRRAVRRVAAARVGTPELTAACDERDDVQERVVLLAGQAARDWRRAITVAVLTERRTPDQQQELDELIANPPPDYRHSDAYNMR